MSFEAIDALAQAVDVALRGDSALTTYLGGPYVFSQEQDQDLALDDYIVLRSKDSGLPWRRFNPQGRGERLAVTMDLYSRSLRSNGDLVLGDQRVLVMAGHVSRILYEAQLALPSYGLVALSGVTLQATAPEPDGKRMKGVVRYEATCRKTT